MSDKPVQPEKPRRPWNIQSLIGLTFAMVGGVSYYFLLRCPWIRAYAIPNTLLILVGVVICFRAVLRKRSRTTLASLGLSVFIGAIFIGSLYYLMNLPDATNVTAVGETAPGFVLPNQDGKAVSLSSALDHGPVLLVFYRGFW